MPFATVNPATNAELRTFKSLSRDQAFDALGKAHTAYRSWRGTSFADRSAILRKFVGILRENRDELAAIVTLEVGKRISESERELGNTIDIFDYYADNAERLLADEKLPAKGNVYIKHDPIGVLLGVMPWNFPWYQVARFAAPNIMAGNVVMVKHAESVPQCALKFQELLEQAGLPKGVYTNLFLEVDLIGGLIADPRVVGVSLTGSKGAGAAVASEAGQSVKKSVLELGGNDPFIVFEDAPLAETIDLAVKGRMNNMGQACIGSKRFIVVEPMAERFISGFKARMAALKIGDPMDRDTEVAPMSSEAAAKNLQDQVDSAIEAGATVLLGGDRPDRAGAYFNPTILTDVKHGDPTYDQELFGPVATVYVVKDEAEAVRLANDSSLGLGGAVFTKDPKRGQRVAEQLETGMVAVNQLLYSVPDIPFGGTKQSGYGRELAEFGIKEFINKKMINLGG